MLTKDNKYLFLAFDHCVEHGVHIYENVNLDPKRIVNIAKKGKVDAIIMHIGSVYYSKPKIPIILKITGKTDLVEEDFQIQTIFVSEEEIKKLKKKFNLVGLAATIYVGSNNESKMIENFVKVKEIALRNNLLVTGFFYPRTKKFDRYSYEAISYSARLGCELNADIIKTYYTGSKETFSKVIKNCFRPIVVAGGKLIEEEKFIEVVKEIMQAGASGIAVGRNIWQREDKEAIELLKELREIIHS
ncbi:MAG: hypothetical protein QXW35_04915 [Candidatus Aenigmatarchaeota archaeon]